MRATALVVLAGLFMGAIAGEPHKPPVPSKPAAGEALPDNRRDPEDPVAQNASGGSSARRAPPEAADIGREADREDEAWRARHQTKPSSRNLR